MELKRLVLFGDSVIASSVFTDVVGFTNTLNENLLGRADVLVRGFSGYTSREIAPLTPDICALRPHLVLLGFGNSDSALAGQIQHVPLDEFRRNLELIAGAIAENGAWPVILTPVAPNEKRIRCRNFDNTAAYALACREVATSMQMEVVDLFHSMQRYDEWETEMLLSDGLSLSAKGHALLAKIIQTVIQHLIPSEEMPRLVPIIQEPASSK
jgi:lysophospholipase L1-like esterase